MNKRIFTIFMIIFTNILGAGVILPVLPLIAVGQFGATIQQATLIATAFFTAQFLAAPWLGKLSDQYGRRPILIISQIGTVLSFVMFTFAAPLGKIIEGTGFSIGISGGLLILFIARTLDGLTGGNITTARAYVSDISRPEDLTQALGMLTAAFGLGFIFGPALGGFLAQINITAPFIGAAVITTFTLILTLITLKESLTPENRVLTPAKKKEGVLQTLRTSPNFIYPLTIGFVQTLAFSAIPPTFALYADRVLFPGLTGPEVSRNVGYMLASFGIVTVLTQLTLIKPMVRKYGERNLIFIGSILLMISLASIPVATSALVVILIFAPSSIGRGLLDPSLQSITTRFGDRKVQGKLLGIYQSSLSLAFIFGPIWSGYVFEKISPGAVFTVGALIMIPGILLSLALKKVDFAEIFPKSG